MQKLAELIDKILDADPIDVMIFGLKFMALVFVSILLTVFIKACI